MRFLHKDFVPLRDYLAAQPVQIRKLEWDLRPVEAGSFAFLPWTVKRRAARPPQAAELAEIEQCFHWADRPENGGTAFEHYFHINAPPSDAAVSLSGAVEHVEAYGAPDEFVLCGYPDGGLISVSRQTLPFQQGLARADDWWGPR
ncbi:MAG: hypothetical protein EOP22_04845 [Hyphomicrobiales bacterium]|nr:MAG: hypothetical protein EOP22_04845 [Hyphomicrobiales bacterium]